jgi:hypothetical protein
VKWCLPAPRWRVALAFTVAIPVLGDCGLDEAAKTLHTENSLRRFRDASQDAVECRAALARDPKYRILDQHMPLTDIDAASLSQMADLELATKGEISALNAWVRELKPCRDRLTQAIIITLPSFRPIFEAGWNDDEAVFVKLAHHKLAWGEAILALKSNATKLQTEVISRAEQVLAEIEKQEETQISRRTAIMGAVIGKLP